ncbi:MAG: PhzF family phenazine biosynthesis protein [Marinicaulis sp.]|nr:PhzF family phenazine biosynthesis protein [Marinicaulis sp.]
MKTFEFETYDVFTDQRFAGNQLAVVMNADGLSTEDMQMITREFNLAESAFILPPENVENTARVRIFTPAYEMPFAGHPTVGTAIAIARARNLSGLLKLELNAGLFPVTVDLSGDAAFAEFQNPNLPSETGAAPPADRLEAALSLPAGSIEIGDHKPRLVGAGVDFVYANAPFDAVRQARVNSAAFEALGITEPVGVLLYAKGVDAPDIDFHVRMFAPEAGVVEDAATGSAAAALPGQIVLCEDLKDGEHIWKIKQGVEMGRPSLINARVQIKNGAVISVHIGGCAVLVQKGQLSY